MMVELKPCPFCGAELEDRQPVEYPRAGLARMHPGDLSDGTCPIAGWGFYDEQLSAWNSRTPSHTSVIPTADNAPCVRSDGDFFTQDDAPLPSASGTVRDKAMEVWQNIQALPYATVTSRTSPPQAFDRDQAAARIIQQYGDQREAEGDAAGYRRGVEDAANWHDEQADQQVFAPRLFHQKSAAKILALLETKEATNG